MRQSPVARTLLLALPVGILVGLAGSVLAADPKLDEASSHIDKAIAALEAAKNEEGPKRMPFMGHRKVAIDHLKKAQREIQKAKAFDDRDDKKDGGGAGPKDGGGPVVKDGGDPVPKDGGDPVPKDGGSAGPKNEPKGKGKRDWHK